MVARESDPEGFDARTDDLGEPVEEMSSCCWKLVATDEPTVVTEPLLDAIVMEDVRAIDVFPIPPAPEAVSETDRLLDQFVTSEQGPRWRWW